MFADDTDPEVSESSTEETEEQEPDVEEEAAEEEAPVKKGDGPPEGSKRWNKVYAGYKKGQQYEHLGSPEEIEDELLRLRAEAKATAKLEDKGKETKESDELKTQRAEIRKKMREVEPGLEKLESAIASQDLYAESLRARAADAVVEQMEEAGQEVTRESHAALAGVLDSIISNDKRLYLTYVTSPEKAVKLAYEKFAAPLQADSERKQKASLLKGKENLKKLPKTHAASSGTGASGAKQAKEPADVREAEKLFEEQLKQLEKE